MGDKKEILEINLSLCFSLRQNAGVFCVLKICESFYLQSYPVLTLSHLGMRSFSVVARRDLKVAGEWRSGKESLLKSKPLGLFVISLMCFKSII